MNVSYKRFANEIFKILKGYGYSIQLFDADGQGPLSSPDYAKFIYAMPYGIMFKLPEKSSLSVQEIVMYKPDSLPIKEFKELFMTIKNVARSFSFEITVRDFYKQITPKDFAHMPAGEIESRRKQLSEGKISISLTDYLPK